MIIACNKIDVKGACKTFLHLKTHFPEYTIVACSAESELALREAAKKELIEYIPGEKEFTVIKKEKLTDNYSKGHKYHQKRFVSGTQKLRINFS